MCADTARADTDHFTSRALTRCSARTQTQSNPHPQNHTAEMDRYELHESLRMLCSLLLYKKIATESWILTACSCY